MENIYGMNIEELTQAQESSLRFGIGSRLYELRKRGGFKQLDVAEAIGVKVSAYRRWETGKADIPCLMLVRLSAFYLVSVDFILGCSVEALLGKDE